MKTKKSLIILAVCSFITFLSSCSFIGNSYNVVIRDAEHGHFEVEYNGDYLCLIIPYPDEGYMPILETISVFGPDKMGGYDTTYEVSVGRTQTKDLTEKSWENTYFDDLEKYKNEMYFFSMLSPGTYVVVGSFIKIEG